MNRFCCVLESGPDVSGESDHHWGLATRCIARFRASTDAPIDVFDDSQLRVCIERDPMNPEPLIAREGEWLAVGFCRFDTSVTAQSIPDGSHHLERIVRLVASHGPSIIQSIVGEFAIVLWHTRARRLIGARDALGVRGLYLTTSSRGVAFASQADILGSEDKYDRAFIAEYFGGPLVNGAATIYDGVEEVSAGSSVSVRRGEVDKDRFWHPERFEHEPRVPLLEATERFRSLLGQSIRYNVSGARRPWLALSGGLDSSSIACLAHSLSAQGHDTKLWGSVTVTDSYGNGDESRYYQAVLDRTGLQNVKIADYSMWRDDGLRPPRTDHPESVYPYYARTRRYLAIPREHGSNTLLTGEGADYYLSGTLSYWADWLSRGKIIATVRSITERAISRRRSFWRYAYREAIRPLVSARRRSGVGRTLRLAPKWVHKRLQSTYEEAARLREQELNSARPGGLFAHHLRREISGLARLQGVAPFEGGIDRRHPFLYRPLVELALCLDPESIIASGGRKRILREAMRGILPEVVRIRQGKGTSGSRVRSAFSEQREMISYLATDPILGQLECVDVGAWRQSLLERDVSQIRDTNPLVSSLALEMWLRVRHDRWNIVPAFNLAAS